MSYPTINQMVGLKSDGGEGINQIIDMMKRCIHEVHDGETVHTKIDMSESDLDEFIESLTTEQFQGLADFFDTMPKVSHSIEREVYIGLLIEHLEEQKKEQTKQ